MFYLYIGYLIYQFTTLIQVPWEEVPDTLNLTQQIILILIFMIPEFLPLFAYYVGRKLSKTKALNWKVLIVLGFIAWESYGTSLNLGLISPGDGNSINWLCLVMLFLFAFIPKEIEFWNRSKVAC